MMASEYWMPTWPAGNSVSHPLVREGLKMVSCMIPLHLNEWSVWCFLFHLKESFSYFVGTCLIQRASEASEADYQSCSIEISDIYIYICRYVCVRQKISPALLIT